MAELVEIAGDYGSGGGSITRFATAMSAVTQKSVKIINIRANRPNPGLQTQHLEGIKAVAELCNAKLLGAKLGSKEIEFYPSGIQAKKLIIKPKTAASIGLIFQILKLPAAFADDKIQVHIKGGAIAGLWSPPIPYLENITLPILSKMGYKADVKINKYGFYPTGNSDVEFTIYPWKDKKPLILEEQGKLLEIEGISIASKFLEKAKVAERQAKAARNILYNKFQVAPKIKIEYVESHCPGSVIVLWIKTENTILGSDAIGQRGVRSEALGQKAARELINDFEIGATVDKHLSDQVLGYMALAKGKSIIIAQELTGHAKTNIWVIEKFLGEKFSTKEISGGVRISCSGS